MSKSKFFILFVLSSLLLCGNLYGKDVRDSVQIYFRSGRAGLDLSIGNNRAILNRIEDSLQTSYADSVYTLKSVTIIGGASPEGSVSINQILSEKRANVLFNYLSKYGLVEAPTKNFIYLGRDYQGLLDLVREDSNVPYRDEVIDLLEDIIIKSKDKSISQDSHYYRLRNLRKGKPYRYMFKHHFPELRSSRLILEYEKIWNPIRLVPVVYSADVQAVMLATPPKVYVPLPIPIEKELPPPPFYMALKTNMLNDLLLTPNVGVEFYLGKNWSATLNWKYAWWNNKDRSWHWRNYGGDLAVRRWFGKLANEKPLTGHHAGLYASAFTHDFLITERGYMAGKPTGNIFDRANFAVGLEYGYSLPIASRLNIDFSLGVGYMWGKYYEYKLIDDCFVWQATKNRRYFGPTKAEISLIWLIGRGNVNEGGR